MYTSRSSATEGKAPGARSAVDGGDGHCGRVGGRGGQLGGRHPVDEEPRGPRLVSFDQVNQFPNILLLAEKHQISQSEVIKDKTYLLPFVDPLLTHFLPFLTTFNSLPLTKVIGLP